MKKLLFSLFLTVILSFLLSVNCFADNGIHGNVEFTSGITYDYQKLSVDINYDSLQIGDNWLVFGIEQSFYMFCSNFTDYEVNLYVDYYINNHFSVSLDKWSLNPVEWREKSLNGWEIGVKYEW